MKKILIPLLLISLSAAGLFAQKAEDTASLRSLVEAERAFARAAAAQGIRDSFLAFIADDGTLFRPLAVNGKKWLEEHPTPPAQAGALLSWRPIFADISRAGDLGYTTGPWEYRRKATDEKAVAFGNYNTVWKKQPDGSWKFLIDIGITNPPPESAAPDWQPPADFGKNAWRAKGKVNVEAEREKLSNRDRAFSQASVAQGAQKAFLSFASEDVRLYRNGAFPSIGRQAAQAQFAPGQATFTWRPVKAEVSSSGDLGYTYGTYELKPGGSDAKAAVETGNYMRIWKRQADGTWRVVLDVTNALPPPNGD
jgi:ketosteroid isomerase-like protein